MTNRAVDEYASAAEAAAALEQLSPAEMIKLDELARMRVRGLTHVEL